MANNRIVHFEIPANEPQALTKFYSDLFGEKGWDRGHLKVGGKP